MTQMREKKPKIETSLFHLSHRICPKHAFGKQKRRKINNELKLAFEKPNTLQCATLRHQQPNYSKLIEPIGNEN